MHHGLELHSRFRVAPFFLDNISPSSVLSRDFQPVVRFFLKLIGDIDHFCEPFRGDHPPAFVKPV